MTVRPQSAHPVLSIAAARGPHVRLRPPRRARPSRPPSTGSERQARGAAARRSIAGTLAVTAASAYGLAAQSAVRVASRPVCRDCEIVLRHAFRVGDATGPGIVPGMSALARDARGRFYFASYTAPGEILVFERTGRFLRALARRGKGPGEFERISWLHASRGDTLHVFDSELGRHTVLSPAFELVRTARLPGFVENAVTLANGQIVINARIPTRESVGQPLHTLSPDGTVERSFGARAGPYLPGMERALQRWLAPAPGNRFWAGHRTAYVIELWDAEGRLHRTVRRDVRWFQPYERSRDLTPREPPLPFMNAVRRDAGGLLWVIVSVPEPSWAAGLERKHTPEGPRYAIADREKVFASVIEIIDPGTGALLVSQRFARQYVAFFGDRLVASIGQYPDGGFYLDLWHVTLARAKGAGQ